MKGIKAIDELRKAHLQYLRSKSTLTDEELVSLAKNRKWTDKTANGLIAMIESYITFIGGFASRTQSQGQFRKDRFSGKGLFTKSTTKKGLADITGVLCSIPLSIEVKVGNDKQSEHQKKVEKQVTSAGGYYYIAKDFQSTYDWMQGDILNQKQTA